VLSENAPEITPQGCVNGSDQQYNIRLTAQLITFLVSLGKTALTKCAADERFLWGKTVVLLNIECHPYGQTTKFPVMQYHPPVTSSFLRSSWRVCHMSCVGCMQKVWERPYVVCWLHAEGLGKSMSLGTCMHLKETNGTSWCCHDKFSLSYRRNAP